MKIGLDIDGVLAAFWPGWVPVYNEWFDARVDADEAWPWNAFVDLTHFHEEDDFWHWTDTVPGFWQNLPVIPGAMAGVTALVKAKHEIVLVTHRHANTTMQTQDWVRRHWPLFIGPSPIIHHTKAKSSVPCQLYIDDGPHALKHLCDAGLPCIKFSQLWNKEAIGNAGAVKGWGELVERVQILAEAIA